MSDYFEPTKFKWIIVVNKKYDKLRLIEGYGGYQDIAEVKLDKKNVRKGLEAIGARQTDIVIVEDVSR